jgi:DNA-binding PadR family transcriptional regulator
MKTAKSPEEVLPLPPYVPYILLSLLKGERHAYRILLDLRKSLEGKTVIGTTTLYRAIDRMVQERLIVESDKRPDPALDDERRTYFRITKYGVDVVDAEAARMEQFVNEWRAVRSAGGQNDPSQSDNEEPDEPPKGGEQLGGWLTLPFKRRRKPKADMGEYTAPPGEDRVPEPQRS